MWHHQDRHRPGPRELTGIVDLTRGEDHPRPAGGPRKVWHRVQELGERFCAPTIQIATLDPFQGYKNAVTITRDLPPASSMPFTSSSSLATSMRYVAASSKTTDRGPYQIRLLCSRRRLTASKGRLP